MNTEDFLAHYGVVGMKWGVRRASNKRSRAGLREKGLSRRQARKTVRTQNRIDHQKAAATMRRGELGTMTMLRSRAVSNSMVGLGTILRHPLSTRNAANRQNSKNAELQTRIGNGEARVRATLLRMQGVSMQDLNFSLDAPRSTGPRNRGSD